MIAWLARNTRPIAAVVLASAVVIVGFEGLDAVVGTSPTVVATEAEGEVGGLASLSGLVKVALFLAVGVGITAAVRSRLSDKEGTE